MKSNIIKYIFILFVIFIVGFAIYTIYDKENNSYENEQADVTSNNLQILTNLRIGIANFDNINPFNDSNC